MEGAPIPEEAIEKRLMTIVVEVWNFFSVTENNHNEIRQLNLQDDLVMSQ